MHIFRNKVYFLNAYWGTFSIFSLSLNTWNRSETWLVLWVSSHIFTHKSVISAASGFQRDYDANIIALNKEAIAATWIGGGGRDGSAYKSGKSTKVLHRSSELWGGG